MRENALAVLGACGFVLLILGLLALGVSNHLECRRAGFSLLYCLSSR
jgi:hypothetical protein